MSAEPLLDKRVVPAGEAEEAGADYEQHITVLTLGHNSSSRRRHLWEGAFWLGTPVLLGLLLGAVLPTNEQCPTMPEPLDRISSIIGWTYFCAWSISFYPQAWLNYRRKSVVGLSLDFQLLNLLGFGCYAVYNAALFWDPLVRREYACLNGGATPAVHANDVFFALHAFIVTAITLVQCAMYDRGSQHISWPAALGAGGAAAAIAAYLAAVVGAAVQGGGGTHPSIDAPGVPCGTILSWLSFLYFLSYVKLAVSLVKYIPQVWLNYKRRSTDGWNMHNVFLDFGGGLLSVVQLVMDGAVTHDWSAVTGNPVKFALGFASMFFDLIFMAQHWLLYPAATAGSFWAESQAAAEESKAAKSGSDSGSSSSGWLPGPPGDASSSSSSSAVVDLEVQQEPSSQGPLDQQPLLGTSQSK